MNQHTDCVGCRDHPGDYPSHTPLTEQRRRDLTDRVAHCFHWWLTRRHPDAVWVRVREREGLRHVAAGTLAGDLHRRVVGPDDVNALGDVSAA